jgi:hypothetical protein
MLVVVEVLQLNLVVMVLVVVVVEVMVVRVAADHIQIFQTLYEKENLVLLQPEVAVVVVPAEAVLINLLQAAVVVPVSL